MGSDSTTRNVLIESVIIAVHRDYKQNLWIFLQMRFPGKSGHCLEEAVDNISNDLKHDSHAVYEFLRATFKHLTEKRYLLSIMPTF